jgi:predicted Fe-Mo cluster-binding NifX family protein
MKIAIPHDNGRLHGHFGGCREFALIEVDSKTKTLVGLKIISAPEHQPGLFPRWLHQQGVSSVIVGGIGRRALDLFAEQGIEVRPGPPGTSVEALVASYLGGLLTGTPEGCTNHGHHHDHDHDHSHDHGHKQS